MQTADRSKKSQADKNASKTSINTPDEGLKVEGFESSTMQKILQKQHLTPSTIQDLQGIVGNQAVIRMLDKKNNISKSDASQTTSSSPLVQRTTGTRSVIDQEHTVDDPGIGDTVGSIGDYMGTGVDGPMGIKGEGTGDHWTGGGGSGAVGATGGSLGTLSGMVGTGINVYNLKQNIESFSNANTILKHLSAEYYGDGQEIPGNTELFATIELLHRQRDDAEKGIYENAVGVYGSLNGIANGIATIVGATAGGAGATIAAAATFGFGSLLGALLGTIGAVRDFMSAGKRAKTKGEVGKVKAGYAELYTELGNQLFAKRAVNEDNEEKLKKANQRVEVANKAAMALITGGGTIEEMMAPYLAQLEIIADANKERIFLEERIVAIASEVLSLAERYDQYDKMVVALTTAERKQGGKGKIGTGILNLVSAGGGAALLALTLGAGAAAGPVGWVLTGVALVGILGYSIGMMVKKKIRSSNVTRMKSEIDLIGTYVSDGEISGKFPPGYTPSGNAVERKNDIWHRDMFPTKETKGWFNKLFSKKKSGTLTISERIAEIHKYLGKYDIGTQGEVATAGFISALKPGSEGDQQVTNPAYSDDLKEEQKENTPQKVTLRELNVGLLAYFFGDGAGEMQDSLMSEDEAMQNNAKKLLNKKLKLG